MFPGDGDGCAREVVPAKHDPTSATNPRPMGVNESAPYLLDAGPFDLKRRGHGRWNIVPRFLVQLSSAVAEVITGGCTPRSATPAFPGGRLGAAAGRSLPSGSA